VEELAYRALLRSPGGTTGQLAEALELSQPRLRRAMATLEHAGLVSRTPGAHTRFLPAAPDVGLAALVLDREAQLGRIRTTAQQWMEDYHQGRRSSRSELYEIVTGSEAVLHRFDQLQRSATEEIQVLDTPPYAGRAGPRTNDLEFEILKRGVVCRAIYDRDALLRSPRAVEAIMRYVAAGEQARVTSHLPLKLATFDRRLAFVPHSVDQHDVAGAIVVHPCSLLDMLLYVFDRLWERATPLPVLAPSGTGDPEPELRPRPDDRRLLALLASGMTDQAISRHLGWSYRTTRRRIAALMTALDADTRFQAGLAAVRRGWL
jgi:sugar-specific transcriptional regulator TrmB/DNA-binding CsgD family transcriptional regulator